MIKKYQNELTKKESDYIQNFTYRTSNFYGQPKIHKSTSITTAIKEQNADYIKLPPPPDLKFRPIVAGPASPTHRLSNFVDIILKPLCKHVPSYIRDDFDFLDSPLTEDTILVSFDVISLYTSIPHELGLKAIEHFLDNFPTTLQRPFSKEFILKAISIVLKENTFKFDGKNYKQVQGTAMGTKMAPTYATLVMGFLEKQLYQRIEEKYGEATKTEFIKNFKRFLDDCFIFWQKSRAEVEILFNMLNNINPKIQFTMAFSFEKLPFLDILICKENTEIHTDIYYKGTDSHQYLDFSVSCHPRHVKQNIPYALARRICTIVTKDDIRNIRLGELETFLTNQNYPKKLINNGIEKAKKLTIEELRNPKKKSDNNNKTLPLVITHNPNNPQIVNMVRQSMNFLRHSKKMESTLKNTELIVSRRQPKNLKQILTKAEFSNSAIKRKVTKCNEPRWGTCNIIVTGDSLILKGNKTWTIHSPMSCLSRDVIYIIICSKCQDYYIGQTQNLRNRVTLHKEQIKHEQYRHLPVSKHLHRCNNGMFRIMPIYQCSNNNRIERESKESNIISILEPKLNACN